MSKPQVRTDIHTSQNKVGLPRCSDNSPDTWLRAMELSPSSRKKGLGVSPLQVVVAYLFFTNRKHPKKNLSYMHFMLKV